MSSALLQVSLLGETGEQSDHVYDGDASVRISNDAAENGFEQEPGPLTWLNSARITTDPDDDAVHCVVSVADPRGGFCFTVRRMPNGEILLHVPSPRDSCPHITLEPLHDGTMRAIHDNGKPYVFKPDGD